MGSAAIRVSAAVGFAGVALGAFGAHGFAPVLLANGTAGTWDTAVLYHLIHAVMLFLTARFNRTAWLLFLAGILVFSGSLYILALSGLRWLGALTPIGGVAFLAGWAVLVWNPSPRE